jgi:hypothetical protein
MRQKVEHKVRLWIDDIHDPPDKNWMIARTSSHAISLLGEIQFDFISFDHDLGGDDNSMKIFDFIEKKFYQDGVMFHFDWFIHSANPAGKRDLHTALTRLFEKINIEQYKHTRTENRLAVIGDLMPKAKEAKKMVYKPHKSRPERELPRHIYKTPHGTYQFKLTLNKKSFNGPHRKLIALAQTDLKKFMEELETTK